MPWHDQYAARQRFGEKNEDRFCETFQCWCGGMFQIIGQIGADITCDNCGRLVDVKSTNKDTGNVALSKTPFEHYPDDLLIAVYVRGRWKCAYRGGLQIEGPKLPTHSERGTPFYLASLSQFDSPEQFGLLNIDQT